LPNMVSLWRLPSCWKWDLLLMAEDIREDYGKTQSAGFALCSRTVYCVIFTENDSLHRIISLRKALLREVRTYASRI